MVRQVLAPHGGKREGAGRRKDQAKVPDEVFDHGFATRVLNRVKATD